MLFKLLCIRFEKKVCLAVASSTFYIAVFIDTIVNFEFCLPPNPLSFSLFII